MHGPRTALRDLKSFLAQRSREQVIGASLAILTTLIIVIIFFVDAKINTAPPPTVVQVELFDSNRTDAEIIADQKEAQAKRDALKEERKRQFKELQDQLGIE